MTHPCTSCLHSEVVVELRPYREHLICNNPKSESYGEKCKEKCQHYSYQPGLLG